MRNEFLKSTFSPGRRLWLATERRFASRCGVDVLVKASGYSRSHLARLVRERYGVSLKKYINELRLSRAYSELLLTDKCAEEIAEQVGFQSFSHFSKIFKERYGRTPASVRRGRHGII